jgi:hypothetical protein
MSLTHIVVTALRDQPNSDAMRWLVSNLLNEYQLNRTGLVGGPIQREDGTHGTTEQVLPRIA